MEHYNEVFRKLKLTPNQTKLIIGAPSDYLIAFKAGGLKVSTEAEIKDTFDFIQLFVESKEILDKQLPKLLKHISPGGFLWICYPKKSSGVTTDLSRDDGWDILKKIAYRPVTQISIDEKWSALRLKPIAEVQPRKKVNTPFINFEKRIVKAPADLQVELDKNELSNTFNNLAFTHKREYVEAIEKAKKPETRIRRIEKTIEMIKQK